MLTPHLLPVEVFQREWPEDCFGPVLGDGRVREPSITTTGFVRCDSCPLQEHS